jgi:hypothetical protein
MAHGKTAVRYFRDSQLRVVRVAKLLYINCGLSVEVTGLAIAYTASWSRHL